MKVRDAGHWETLTNWLTVFLVLPLLKSALFKWLLTLLCVHNMQNLLGWLLTSSLCSSGEKTKTIALNLCIEEIRYALLWLYGYFSHIINIHCFDEIYVCCIMMTSSSTKLWITYPQEKAATDRADGRGRWASCEIHQPMKYYWVRRLFKDTSIPGSRWRQ